MAKKNKSKKSTKKKGANNKKGATSSPASTKTSGGSPPKASDKGPRTTHRKQPETKPASQTYRMVLIGATVILGGFLLLNVIRLIPRPGTSAATTSIAEGEKRAALSDTEIRALGPYVSARFKGESPTAPQIRPAVAKKASAAYVGVRAAGKRLSENWSDGPDLITALNAAIDNAKRRMGNGTPTALEIVLGHSFRTVTPGSDRRGLTNVNRGVLGIEFIHNDKATRYGPTQMIAMNRSFDKAMAYFEQQNKLSKGETKSAAVRVRLFDADQLIVRLDKAEAVPTFRGNEIVDIKSVSAETTQKLADALSTWLFTNLQPDGREVYKWWPTRDGEASTSNNMIRQWMATVAMGRVATVKNDDALQERVAQNIRYNIGQFYHDEGSYGVIEFRGQVKLGAIALAALSMFEHPQRSSFAPQEQAIQRTMDYLYTDSGRFKTFFKPANADRNHNFYPGEAQLYWAALYEQNRDPKLLEKYMKVFEYYKGWHMSNRNPAFIPWHTQANYKVWALTKDEGLKDFTFVMNDWLLGVQQWDENTRFPDTNGRFYDPSRPFGPPHASSTGVYLEGLIDAWRMARDVGDDDRKEKYRRAIVRGLRSVMQLTFFDDVDMYYVSKRDRTFGGVRTTVYDNVIRVDNVQHALMGILRIIQYFAPEDYRP